MFVVCGVTGQTGKVVAERLADLGLPLRVVVRDPEKAARWRSRRAEVVQASLQDAAALTRALKGADGAYVLIPPRYDAEDLLAAQRPVTEALARAVRDSGVPHVVLLSSIGAQHPAGTGPIRSLHHAEEAIGRSAKSLTVLRACYFLENWSAVLGEVKAKGVLPSFLTPGRPVPMVATRDIGRAAAEALLDPPPGRRLIELRGPRSWTPEEVAAAIGKAAGREVRAQGLPLDAIVPAYTSMGIPAGTAALFREMIEGINNGHVAWEEGAAIIRLGTLTPAEVLGPLLAPS